LREPFFPLHAESAKDNRQVSKESKDNSRFRQINLQRQNKNTTEENISDEVTLNFC